MSKAMIAKPWCCQASYCLSNIFYTATQAPAWCAGLERAALAQAPYIPDWCLA